MTQASVAFVIFLTWVLNTFSQSQSKRAAAVALIISTATFGNAGSSSVRDKLTFYTVTDAAAVIFGRPVGDLHM